ncbi:MAG: hypothetical protein H0V07_09785 [Propionibacteriales bacterium]|nr:hypothetical protein [Propionibacteriales bacterium]
MSWLDPVRAALDADHPRRADRPTCDVFFRDDDAGWDDNRLRVLLDVFDHHRLVVDLAVIPIELTGSLVAELTARARAGLVRLHQHGYAHVNHEVVGRKCEFGPTRRACDQAADVAAGRRRMVDAFEDLVDPVFTPPWNRCEAETGDVLVAEGFQVLSRDVTAPRLDRPDLVEIPVTIDWYGHRKGVRWTRDELANRIAAGVAGGGPVGVMLHHAVTDDGELSAIEDLLRLFAANAGIRTTTIQDLAADSARPIAAGRRR